ncbi:MAG: glutaminase A [Thermomicrobiales bacterium]|nr:glutaminase A [Thermomicrobiales bacterium]
MDVAPPAPDSGVSGRDGQFVSTGGLPHREVIRQQLEIAHQRFAPNDEGENARVYPALAAVPRELFGLCLASVSGRVDTIGDAGYPFTIMSVSKPFVFALVCNALGSQEARERLGVNATGLPFNSIIGVELGPGHRTNPMVNSGALATTSLVPGDTPEAQWHFVHDGLSRFAGRDLAVNDEVYASASATNQRNRAIAQLLESYRRLGTAAAATTELYTRQCALDVTARDLAVMGATLANGGVNPVTGERVVGPGCARRTLAVMATAGLYETSGDWLYDIGLPGKSGIGGGIVTVAPGKGGFGAFAPPLDHAGNSIKGQRAARFLSERLGLNLFASQPAETPAAEGAS